MLARFRVYIAVIFLHISALYHSRASRDLYQTSFKMMLLKNAVTANDPVKTGPFPDHPKHAEAMKEFKQSIKDFKANPFRPARPVIAVTDSLSALRKDQTLSIDLHFGIPGLGGNQYARILIEIHAELVREGIQPSALVLGCVVGNMLLARYAVDQIEAEFYGVYDMARKLFPAVRIVLYGLPPVMDAYALTYTWYFENVMAGEVEKDVFRGGNACFVSLKKFSSFLGLLPTAKLSSDTVHFSDRGFIRFEKLILDAIYGRGVFYA